MYAVAVSRECPARHYLTVPDAGPEGEPHEHPYVADVRLSGESLDEHGYLVDIDDVEAALDDVVARYRDATLNDLPEFDGNPSAERFARQFCDRLVAALDAPNVDRVRVTIREDDSAAGAYERPR